LVKLLVGQVADRCSIEGAAKIGLFNDVCNDLLELLLEDRDGGASCTARLRVETKALHLIMV
jgi:hypothetical protein